MDRILVDGGDRPAVGRPGDRQEAAWPVECAELAAGVPDAHGPVAPRGREPPPVGSEGDTRDLAGGVTADRDRRRGGELPELNLSVPAAQSEASGRERERVDHVVELERRHLPRRRAADVPHVHRPVVGRCREHTTIGCEAERGDPAGVPGDGLETQRRQGP